MQRFESWNTMENNKLNFKTEDQTAKTGEESLKFGGGVQ